MNKGEIPKNQSKIDILFWKSTLKSKQWIFWETNKNKLDEEFNLRGSKVLPKETENIMSQELIKDNCNKIRVIEGKRRAMKKLYVCTLTK